MHFIKPGHQVPIKDKSTNASCMQQPQKLNINLNMSGIEKSNVL